MGPLPVTTWIVSLDQMEDALGAALRALDRSEERWELALAPSAGEGEQPVALGRDDERLAQWEERLRAAEGLTRSVEAELAARTEAVDRWRSSFARWQEVLQRTPGSTSGS